MHLPGLVAGGVVSFVGRVMEARQNVRRNYDNISPLNRRMLEAVVLAFSFYAAYSGHLAKQRSEELREKTELIIIRGWSDIVGKLSDSWDKYSNATITTDLYGRGICPVIP